MTKTHTSLVANRLWFLGLGLGLFGLGLLLSGCASASQQGTPSSGAFIQTPTPTPDRYALDVPELGLRLWLPHDWQAVQGEGPTHPWVFLVPVSRYSDEDEAPFPPPLLQAEEEGILLPPDPPYMLVYVYFRPESRPWEPREVYFALDELGILTEETVETFSSPTPFQGPRGTGWYADLRLITGDEDVLQARLSIMDTPFSGWTFALWGVAPENAWDFLQVPYQQMLFLVDFVQAPPAVEEDS